MSDQNTQGAVTVTRGGQVIVIISSIKTKEVSSLTHSTPTEITIPTTAVLSDTTASSGILTYLNPTTFFTSTRAQTPPPVIIVTKVVTITASPTTSLGTPYSSIDETSVPFTRPSESRPIGIGFPVGPAMTSEGSSPLKTGGVHTPQEEFNGLAASPGVIVGTFAALVGVGFLLCLGCWVRRKRYERKMKLAGVHPGSMPPSLPPISKYLHSPNWFGKRSKGNSTELKNMQPSSIGPATGEPSLATTPVPLQPVKPTGQGVISDVHETQQDPHRDILSTEGEVSDRKRFSPKHQDSVDDLCEKENTAPATESRHEDIGMAVTEPEAVGHNSTKQSVLANELSESPKASSVPGSPGVCELADTNPYRQSQTHGYGYKRPGTPMF